MSLEPVMVSVKVLTYNHAGTLRQAMESILMQKVKFPYEIIIGDDCSQDGTQEILKEFQREHPDKITVVFQKENLGATGNSYSLLPLCRGKYIAPLEGDDFWLDPFKLQKQVDFLEHASHVAIYNDVLLVDEDGKPIENARYPGFISQYPKHDHIVYTLEDWGKWIIPGQTGGMMMRNIFKDSTDDFSIIPSAHRMMGDRTIALLLALRGTIYCDSQILSAYRYNPVTGSSFSAMARDGTYAEDGFNYFMKIYEYHEEQTGRRINTFESERNLLIARGIQFIHRPNLQNLKLMVGTFLDSDRKPRMLRYALTEAPVKACKIVVQRRKSREKG